MIGPEGMSETESAREVREGIANATTGGTTDLEMREPMSEAAMTVLTTELEMTELMSEAIATTDIGRSEETTGIEMTETETRGIIEKEVAIDESNYDCIMMNTYLFYLTMR
jgi:hypothetical protein